MSPFFAYKSQTEGGFIQEIALSSTGQVMVTLFFTMIMLVLSSPRAVAADNHPARYGGRTDRLLLIAYGMHEPGHDRKPIAIEIPGDGRILDYSSSTMLSPPRIAIDIFGVTDPFRTMMIPVKHEYVKDVRIGFHQDKVGIVLDLKTDEIPSFTAWAYDQRLFIVLNPRDTLARGEGTRQAQVSPNETESKTIGERKALEIAAAASSGRYRPGMARSPRKKDHPPDRLTQLPVDDGREDTAIFIRGLNAYHARDWRDAIDNFERLAASKSGGRHAERAYFLLAKSYEHLYSSSLLDHSDEIKGRYEAAISEFPHSSFVPDALLALGNLCFKTRNYSEALGYYNLVLRKDTESNRAFEAMIQKIEILLLKGQKKEALSIARHLTRAFPDPELQVRAKTEMAIVLYKMNSFRKSLELLTGIEVSRPEAIYLYPEISLYLGRNYYELGDNARARENLIRFYNIRPDSPSGDYILTKIADTYRNEGAIHNAVKFYELVLDRHPGTEGAIISQLRLAELQEEGKFKADMGLVPVSGMKRQAVGLPVEIYEDITARLSKEDGNNPLLGLTLLKLATGYRKDGKYQESLDALKRLRRKQPRLSGVRREFQHALAQTMDGLLGGWMKKGAYENIVNLYLEERDLFDLIESPAPMLTVARASMQLGLEEFALEVFRRADPLLQDHEKPADLLISLGRESLKKGRLEKALAMADLIIKNHPGDMLVPLAYQLKGRVLYQKGKYPPAGEMFASALGFNPEKCDRVDILLDRARTLTAMASRPLSLTAMASRTKALEALREADRMIKDCTLPSPHSYEEMARLYHDLGNPRKAISILYREIDKKAGEDRARVMFMIARYYEALGNREKSNEIFKQILNGKSPFWSILARERLEEAAFDKELGK